jgi:hypothetical protein
LDKLLFLLCGLLLFLLGVLPDFLGLGQPGIGTIQWLLFILGFVLCAVPFVLNVRPWTAIKAFAAKLGIGRREALLFGCTSIASLVVFDLILRSVLPPVYEWTKTGWDLAPNSDGQRIVEDTRGNHRTVTERYFEHGFKRWGELGREGRAVLIIGDSFTHMPWVSNGEEWYAYLERDFEEWEFFVFGSAGYGSLQQFLVLDEFFDTINPDVILWQFCTNDYGDNLYALDREEFPLNNYAFRPYLEGDEIVYRLPLPLTSVREVSVFADRVLAIYDRHRQEWVGSDRDRFVQDRTREREAWPDEKKRHREALLREALEVTSRIMTKVRRRVSETPVYLFNPCAPISDEDRKVCAVARYECIEGVYEHVLEMERAGKELAIVNDGHWNREGNQIVGEWLASYFKARGVF